MGLIRAAIGAAGGVLADQWKEFYYCPSLDDDVLVVRGEKQQGGRSSNTAGHNNVISNGSGIAVADGQCMLIVDQGEIIEVCAEPGQFIYDSSREPSIFAGDLGTGIIESFKAFGRRFTFGGDTAREQRIYYINTKHIKGNKFGTQNPIPFRVVDSKIGLDIDVSVRCNGNYTYQIKDPILFYKNVSGNVEEPFERKAIDSDMRSELVTHLGPAFAEISELEVRPNQLPGKNLEISEALKEELSHKWLEIRGIEIVSVSLNSVTIPQEDEDLIKQLQRAATMRNPNMAAANLTAAQADAMRYASENEAGAFTGFMGLGMAGAAGGINSSELFRMGQQQQVSQQLNQHPGQFEAQQPSAVNAWICSQCGAPNRGNFCMECGRPKPESTKYRCDKCGWESKGGDNPPKFCPNCGDVINENDKIR